MPPCLYHSIEKLGTEGGFRLKLPLILGCGSFRCGSDQEKLKNPFILSMAFFTVSLAVFIGVEMAVLIGAL